MQLNFGIFAEQYRKMSPMICMEGAGRIDVGVADHELFQNVVLNGSAQVLGGDALLFGGHDIERHDRQNRAVHGHRDGHLPQRDLVEEDLHVFDRIDGHAGLADIARDALVVRIVAAMRRQVEGHRETLLARREIAAIEGVGLFGGGEAGVLADGPRLHGIHRGVGPAQKWRHARGIVQVLHGVQDRAAVYHAFTGMCSAVFQTGALSPGPCRRRRSRSKLVFDLREVRSHWMLLIPSLSCHSVRVWIASLKM